MKNKRTVWLAIAGAALLGITALCVLTGYGLVRWVQNSGLGPEFLAPYRYDATASETLTYDPEGLVGVRLGWTIGSITLKETDEDQIRMELEKTTWGASAEDAQANAEALKPEVEVVDGWQVFTFSQATHPNVFSLQDPTSQINVKLYLPKGLAAELFTSSGDLSVTDFHEALTLQNRFGAIQVTNHTGALNIEGNSGDVILTNIDAGDADFSLHSSFGDLTMENVQAGNAEIGTLNGDINITGFSARKCYFSDDFGSITLEDFSCESFLATMKNGPIDLTDGVVNGNVEISSDFGAITLDNVDADSYEVSGGNGDVNLDGVTGSVTVDGGFGDIKIVNGVDVVLDLQNDNGSIFYSGSISPEHNHSISSQFGKVTLEMPEDTSLDIDLKTQFGTIKSDFPVTLQGEIDSAAMQGYINDGGALLKIEANNGDIVLKIIQ